MPKGRDIILAIKCAPEKKILSAAKEAGIGAVELYLSGRFLDDLPGTIKVCRDFSFGYAVHAPDDGYNPARLAELTETIGAKIVIFHNIYWEDEWGNIVKIFKNIKTRVCVENTFSIHEPLKFIRRYGIGRCLDLEHFQMECAGIYEEAFIPAIMQACHIHLTGYVYGSQLWHTHIHHSPGHNLYMLNLLRKAGYSGFVVSEAKASLQTYKEFKNLNDFYKSWISDKEMVEK